MSDKNLVVVSKVVKCISQKYVTDGYIVLDKNTLGYRILKEDFLFDNRNLLSNVTVQKNVKGKILIFFDDCGEAKVPQVEMINGNNFSVVKDGIRILEKDVDTDTVTICSALGKVNKMSVEGLINLANSVSLVNACVSRGNLKGTKKSIPVTMSTKEKSKIEDRLNRITNTKAIENLEFVGILINDLKDGLELKFKLRADIIKVPQNLLVAYTDSGKLNLEKDNFNNINQVIISTNHLGELCDIIRDLSGGVIIDKLNIILKSNNNEESTHCKIVLNLRYDKKTGKYDIFSSESSEGYSRILNREYVKNLKSGVEPTLGNLMKHLYQIGLLEIEALRLLRKEFESIN